MRIVTGKVEDGKVLVEPGSLREGATVTVLMQEESRFTLTPEEKEVLLGSIAEADRGELSDARPMLDEPVEGE